MLGVVTGVLDVKDDTPLISPSSSQLTTPVHNRSIVVLTPTQAIKFTALSRERHISWLTALNFLVHNDPADLVIPRGITTSPSNNSLWAREPVYPTSATASSIASSTTHHGPNSHPNFGSYTIRKNSLPDFVPNHPPREDTSPLGYKHRYDDGYAIPLLFLEFRQDEDLMAVVNGVEVDLELGIGKILTGLGEIGRLFAWMHL